MGVTTVSIPIRFLLGMLGIGGTLGTRVRHISFNWLQGSKGSSEILRLSFSPGLYRSLNLLFQCLLLPSLKAVVPSPHSIGPPKGHNLWTTSPGAGVTSSMIALSLTMGIWLVLLRGVSHGWPFVDREKVTTFYVGGVGQREYSGGPSFRPLLFLLSLTLFVVNRMLLFETWTVTNSFIVNSHRLFFRDLI